MWVDREEPNVLPAPQDFSLGCDFADVFSFSFPFASGGDVIGRPVRVLPEPEKEGAEGGGAEGEEGALGSGGVYGTTLKPKNSFPNGRLSAAGTLTSASVELLLIIFCWSVLMILLSPPTASTPR